MKTYGQDDTRPDGDWKTYRKTATAEMLKMDEPFLCTNREAEEMTGQAGDFLTADGYGGYYPCGAEFHAENYAEVKGDTE